MPTARSSMDLVRSATDEQVLRAFIAEPRLTRAELSVLTGLSKPTASESVRRLTEAGLLTDTGQRTTGRGRAGSYYSLSTTVGAAVAVDIAPAGLTVEVVDVRGEVVARVTTPLPCPATAEEVAARLHDTVLSAHRGAGVTSRVAVVSAADPVDRLTGRLVQLPDAPFLVGELDTREVLAELVRGPVLVDNDVNWAARAERDASAPQPLEDFTYLHLGAGLGCAIVSDGEVRRGHRGLAGEVAHVVTIGPGDRAVRFTEVFAELGLRRPGSTAIDTGGVLRVLDGTGADARGQVAAVAAAVSGVLAATVTLTDPQVVVLGGPWGTHPELVRAVRASIAGDPRSVPVRAAALSEQAPLHAARAAALAELRAAVLSLPGRRPADDP